VRLSFSLLLYNWILSYFNSIIKWLLLFCCYFVRSFDWILY
jgi:hypothetical protein